MDATKFYVLGGRYVVISDHVWINSKGSWRNRGADITTSGNYVPFVRLYMCSSVHELPAGLYTFQNNLDIESKYEYTRGSMSSITVVVGWEMRVNEMGGKKHECALRL